MTTQSTTRTYRKRRRAEQEAATRLRITEAAVALHGSVGPARTTIKALADTAGVQRATVYRHFPDEESLFLACTSHWSAQNPAPSPDDWLPIADPDERLRVGLADLYTWFKRAEPMLVNSLRDAAFVPAMGPAAAAFDEQFATLHAALVRGRPERGRRRTRVAAAIGHAIAFTSWMSLTRENGLSDSEAIDLMAATVDAARR